MQAASQNAACRNFAVTGLQMILVTYIRPDGSRYSFSIQHGASVMEGAVWNGMNEILASCGGDGGCATCHIYVDEPWRSKLGSMSAKKRRTLRFAADVTGKSRLSCFIRLTGEMDGLVVQLPSRQY